MKRIVVLLIGILSLSSCEKDDRVEPENNNETSLATIKQTLYAYSYGNLSNFGREWNVIDFDPNGNIVKESIYPTLDYNSNVNVARTTTYTYKNNVLVEYRDWNWRYVNTYKDGKLSIKDIYNSNGLSRRYSYQYKGGVLESEYEYFLNFDEPSIKKHYTYEGGKISIIDIDYSSIDNGQLVYTYDERGNLLTEVYKIPSKGTSTLQIDNKYEYDSNGRISVKLFKESITRYRATYKYIDDTNLISEVYYEKNLSGDTFDNWAVVKYEYIYK